MRRNSLSLGIAFALIAGLPALADVPYFVGLGDFAGGDHDSWAYGVSGDGTTVVGFGQHGTTAHGNEGFRWKMADGIVGLGVLPGDRFSDARAISSDATVIVGSSSPDSGPPEAYRWTALSGLVGLGSLPGSTLGSQGYGISDNGSVIVGRGQTSSGYQAFRWTDGGGMVGLGLLNSTDRDSVAYDASQDGSVVVGVSENSVFVDEAWRWTQSDGMVGLGNLEGGEFSSQALSVSADGSVVVGWSNTAAGREAFRWTETTGMVSLGDLPGGMVDSEAQAVSADGSIIVGFGQSTGNRREPFIWDAQNGMRSLQRIFVDGLGLDLLYWDLTRTHAAYGISADGMTIVGNGFNQWGENEAWVAHIPEPAVGSLLLVALPLLRRSRR
ncbi:MAG TPA: PEP-CTERM sorting domain-containing protein [Phycisphaerae bacterium]|nr:PEP-CTERM sorting domain-containing protein [Phycisphaerae bacterium]